jgi:Luciferase
VADDAADEMWDAVVTAMRAAGPVHERRSRHADKPALWTDRREIAHLEAPGVVDMRITAAGWRRAKGDFGAHPAVSRDPARRDWIELRPASAAEVSQLAGLLAIAVAAND